MSKDKDYEEQHQAKKAKADQDTPDEATPAPVMTAEEYDAIGKGPNYKPHNTDNTFVAPEPGEEVKPVATIPA